MKKFLSLSFLLTLSFAVFSQCIPDPEHSSELVYPDTITNLPHAQVATPYEAIISANIPTDTTIEGYPVTVNSLQVDSIIGLPEGFTWSANTDSAIFNGGTSGCISITGTPTAEMAGKTYALTIHLNFSAMMGGIVPLDLPYPLTYYRIIVDSIAPDTMGIKSFENFYTEAYPNPAKNIFNLKINSLQNSEVSIEIIDMLGQVVLSSNKKISAGENLIELNVSSLKNGFYFYSVDNGKTKVGKKLIIQK